jgi:hypothetical protein
MRLIAAASLLMLSSLASSLADFTGPYALPSSAKPISYNSGRPPLRVDAWTLQTDGNSAVYSFPYVIVSSAEVDFYTGLATTAYSGNHMAAELTNTIAGNGLLTFDYSLAFEPGLGGAGGGYILDGLMTKLAAGTGTVSVPVEGGQLFGFFIFASETCQSCDPLLPSDATMFITDFSAPIPEPPLTSLFVVSVVFLVAVSVVRVRRNRNQT